MEDMDDDMDLAQLRFQLAGGLDTPLFEYVGEAVSTTTATTPPSVDFGDYPSLTPTCLEPSTPSRDDSELAAEESLAVTPVVVPVQVKRRIMEKSKPTAAWASVSPYPGFVMLPQAVHPANLPNGLDDWWDRKSHTEKYDYVYNKLRRGVYAEFKSAVEMRRRRPQKWPSAWTSLSVGQRRELVNFWIAKVQDTERAVVQEWARENIAKAKQTEYQSDRWCRSKNLLLTYQGDFGHYLAGGVTKETDIADLVAIVQVSDFFEHLWAKAVDNMLIIVTEVKAAEYALCAELCTESHKERGETRIHFHLCLRANSNMEVRRRDQLSMLGSLPHIRSELTAGQRKRQTDWCPYYYCTAPKVGQLKSRASKKPHRDFLVNQNWIWHLLSTGKMSLEDGKTELIATAKNLPRQMECLERWRSELSGLALRQRIVEREQELSVLRKPFRRIAAVEQFKEDHARLASRKKFLVLDGPSRTGKTVFAMALVPPGRGLELNCSGTEDPPMKEFRHEVHDLVLFDEGSCSMVLKYKKLFQSPNAAVTIGSSATNMYAYSVYVHSTMMVIASNVWRREITMLRPEDRSWLEANQVLIEVDQPLFL